jgi:hypothetical protein
VTSTTFDITDPVTERVIASHHRIDVPGKPKRVWWTSPSNPHGLPDGMGTSDLPLYRQSIALRERSPLLIVEGEKSAEALAMVGIHAVATVTGAASAPKPEAIRAQVSGRIVLAWPDNDDAGRAHMDKVLSACRKAGATATGVIDYRSDAAPWPKGFDAADLVGYGEGSLDPAVAREIVGMLIESWARQWEQPLLDFMVEKITTWEPGLAGSVTTALFVVYGIEARPGQTIRCPMHGDRSASLWITPKDDRAICMTPSCLWAKPGADANDVKNVRIELR